MKLRVFLILLAVCLVWAAPVAAQEPMVGEIRLWAGPSNTIPDGWTIADGADLSTSTYASLYAVVGCTYGCSGSDFKLPDMKGRVAVGYSTTGADSEFDTLGEKGGSKTHTLTVNEMPNHTHLQNPHNHTISGAINGSSGTARRSLLHPTGTDNVLSSDTTAVNQNTGGGQAHNNLQPYITLYYIIYTGVLSATPTPTATPTGTPTQTPTPTATPTGSVTPTATSTNTTYLPYVITTTLNSGTVLSVPEQVSFGQIITSGIVLSLLAVVGLDFLFRLVYRR